MAAVVEAQERPAASAGVGFQRRCLGAGHVRHEAAAEDEARPAIAGVAGGGLVVGQAAAVRPREKVGLLLAHGADHIAIAGS